MMERIDVTFGGSGGTSGSCARTGKLAHMDDLDSRIIHPIDASHPELGRWLWALEDTRARTKEAVAGLDQAALDWTMPGVENSIGSLLYHIALIESDYLYADILAVDYPAWLFEADAFAIDVRDAEGKLSVVAGVPLDEHLARMDRVRDEFVSLVSKLTVDELATARDLPEYGYRTSPAWVLHHLMQHEAEHRGQITAIRTLWEQASMPA
jgi:uncharacterized damage-inducible protein DinB